MTEQSEPISKKLLARNVPVDFMLCVERERVSLTSDDQRHRGVLRRGPAGHARRYSNIIAQLSEQEFDEPTVAGLVDKILEIEIRYLVLSKTLDQSVPPTPIRKTLKQLENSVRRTLRNLKDPDRDLLVKHYRGQNSDDDIDPSTKAFYEANSFAERASVTNAIVAKFADELSEMSKYFDYKANLTGRGNPTKYATLYAVYALADLFERANTYGIKANVNHVVETREYEETGGFFGDFRYEGRFLRFVTNFFGVVDDSQFQRAGLGLQDRIRKLGQARKKDPSLFELLHENVSVETLLEFMRRADAGK